MLRPHRSKDEARRLRGPVVSFFVVLRSDGFVMVSRAANTHLPRHRVRLCIRRVAMALEPSRGSEGQIEGDVPASDARSSDQAWDQAEDRRLGPKNHRVSVRSRSISEIVLASAHDAGAALRLTSSGAGER